MSRRQLFDAMKEKLGFVKDIELEPTLGVKRSFLSLMVSGRKAVPDRIKTIASATLNISVKQVDSIIDMEEISAESIRTVLSAMRGVLVPPKRQSGVLPDKVSGRDAEGAPAGKVPARQKRARQGRSEPADLIGQPGAGAEAGASAKPAGEAVAKRRTPIKRGTRAAVVLREGGIYYPDGVSDHTHRRLVGIVRMKDRPPTVIYSTGSDHNRACLRSTFLRWLDPTKLPATKEVEVA